MVPRAIAKAAARAEAAQKARKKAHAEKVKAENAAARILNDKDCARRAASSMDARIQRVQLVQPSVFKRQLPKASRYIIAAAQNATPVHAQFWETLKVAAEQLKAEIIVIPLRYRNPTSILEGNLQDDDNWWNPVLVPHLFDGRVRLNRNLTLVADVKVQPTAGKPLAGLESMTGAESCIIGHPKMQYLSVPVPSGRFPKILTTTGVVTERNYSDTKSGKVGEFHHFLGALLVEVVNENEFHLRQLNADRDDGSFIDVDVLFTPEGARPAPPAEGLVMGDIHVDVTDEAVDRATFGPGGIVEAVNPKTIVAHDVADGGTTNPHELGDPFASMARRKGDRADVEAELRRVVEYLNARAVGRNVVVVDSNHHDFLVRWLKRTDWRQDLKNAAFYLRMAKATLDSCRMTPAGPAYDDPFILAMRELGLKANIRCLGPDESFKLADIECGLHGHRGPNGARGSLNNLSRLGTKTITGHSHTPGIQEGGYAVGTSTPRRLHYAHGPSSWLNTHCVVYANGKRALLTIIDGKWRL